MAASARFNDMVKHDGPHCHAPIHPPAPVPTPVAHPALPLNIVLLCIPTVKINNQQAAVVGSMSKPCMLPSCVPAGPGLIAKGSSNVLIMGLPAARKGDMVAFASCVAVIPSPTGTVQSPCSTDVDAGG